jgi:hypothetical protein
MPPPPRYFDNKGSSAKRPRLEAVENPVPHWETIDSTPAADFLSNPRTAALINPFIAKDCTIKHAAVKLEISALRMFRAVKKMEALGLLCVTRIETRRGRPVKHYRASSDAYFVPYRVTGADNLEEFLMAQDEHLRRVFVRSFAEYLRGVLSEQGSDPGRIIYRDDHGNVTTHSVGGLDDPRGMTRPILESEAYTGWSNYSVLRLDLERSRALKRELVELFEKYRAHSGERGYIVRLGMAPLKDSVMELLER